MGFLLSCSCVSATEWTLESDKADGEETRGELHNNILRDILHESWKQNSTTSERPFT